MGDERRQPKPDDRIGEISDADAPAKRLQPPDRRGIEVSLQCVERIDRSPNEERPHSPAQQNHAEERELAADRKGVGGVREKHRNPGDRKRGGRRRRSPQPDRQPDREHHPRRPHRRRAAAG
jgi:hypothetical protein